MFTEEDLNKLTKIKNEYNEKRQQQSKSSEFLEDKTEQQLYIKKYFLHDGFKIFLIQIARIEQVNNSLSHQDSYMAYIIKVLTQQFSYEVRRRYNEFLKLYESTLVYSQTKNQALSSQNQQKIDLNKLRRLDYSFPVKKISSSLRNFFNISTKQKLANQRKNQLCSFLNQIKSNYYNNNNLYKSDYVQLLKFLNMKEQHQKFWQKKQGRFLQLSNLALKDSNGACRLEKSNEVHNYNVNIQYLQQLLQHQMNKINIACLPKQDVRQSSFKYNSVQQNISPMVTDQIIKNIDCIRDIVFQMKRKINYDHIRCILKGKDIKQAQNTIFSKQKKGLIEYSIRHTNNQIVAMYIMKMVLFVFMNCQYNYSSDAFIKVMSELQMSIYILDQEKQQWALHNKQFRQIYFKVVKQYLQSRQTYSADRKNQKSQAQFIHKIMSITLSSTYLKWIETLNKNKQFKIRDQQKQWALIIQNLPKTYRQKQYKQMQKCVKIQQNYNKNECKNMAQNIKDSKMAIKFTKKQQNEHIKMFLKTQINRDHEHIYRLSIKVKQKSYQQCIQLIKQQKKWNPLLVNSYLDVYSNTRKDFYKMPGKQEKMFRFVEHEQIQMEIQSQAQNQQPFIDMGTQQQQANEKKQSSKSSINTMPSASGSCAHQFQPQNIKQNLSQNLSKMSQKLILSKSEPRQSSIKSFFQKVEIEKGTGAKGQYCSINFELVFTDHTTQKYFMSQLNGTSTYIWQGVRQCFNSIDSH